MNVAVCCAYFRDCLVEQLVHDLAQSGAEVHLWALQSVLPGMARFTRGTGPVGKFQAINQLRPYTLGADIVLLVDDDVRLPGRFLHTYMAIVTALGATVAQPALTGDSYYSHSITLERKGC